MVRQVTVYKKGESLLSKRARRGVNRGRFANLHDARTARDGEGRKEKF